MDAAIRQAINTLKNDRSHGAGWLTRQAIRILGKAAAGSKAATVSSLAKEVKTVAAALLIARPGMVSVANYVLIFDEEFKQNAAGVRTVAAQKKQCASIAGKLVNHCEQASAAAARKAAALIDNKSIILTCSYSSSVCDALKAARENGRDFRVLAAESKSSGKSFGRLMARELKKTGIIAKIFPDDQAGWHIARADMVLLGTDAVSQQGWMINGTPSLELCRWAKKRKMPVYVVCDIAKIDAHGILATMREPVEGFDMVPFELVAAFITGAGMLKPDDIYNIKPGNLFNNQHA